MFNKESLLPPNLEKSQPTQCACFNRNLSEYEDFAFIALELLIAASEKNQSIGRLSENNPHYNIMLFGVMRKSS